MASPTAPSITWTLSCPKQLTQGEWMARLLTHGGTDYLEAGDSPPATLRSELSHGLQVGWGSLRPTKLLLLLPSSIPPGFEPARSTSGAQASKLEAISPGGVLSCPPDPGTLFAHFALGSAHLVCASVYVYCCAPLPPWSYTWGAHYSGDIEDAIFTDCCMILKTE